jgi:hypothetical protein
MMVRPGITMGMAGIIDVMKTMATIGIAGTMTTGVGITTIIGITATATITIRQRPGTGIPVLSAYYSCRSDEAAEARQAIERSHFEALRLEIL